MDILKKAEKNSVMPVENKYVFNDIYFGEKGLTSASASHISAMATRMADNLREHVKGLRLWRKYIRVIGEDESLVEDRKDILGEMVSSADQIAKCNALVAWLREAIKERDKALDEIRDTTLNDWAKDNGIEIPLRKTCPKIEPINFQDIKTILGAGLTLKEYNRVMELNSTLAVYGEFIHKDGILTKQAKKLQELANEPINVYEGGRDTIITRYEPDDVSAIDDVYTEMQKTYRKLQAEKNGIDAKWSKLSALYQIKKQDEQQEMIEECKQENAAIEATIAELSNALKKWKQNECNRIASLKIVIPNDLKEIYTKICEKYA